MILCVTFDFSTLACFTTTSRLRTPRLTLAVVRMRAPPAQHTSQQVVQVARKRTHHKQQQHTRVLFPFPAAACRTSCRRRHVVTKSSTLSGASSSRVPKPLLPLNTHLYEYILEHTREHQTLRDLRAATCDYPHGAQMQVPPEQAGQLRYR